MQQRHLGSTVLKINYCTYLLRPGTVEDRYNYLCNCWMYSLLLPEHQSFGTAYTQI